MSLKHPRSLQGPLVDQIVELCYGLYGQGLYVVMSIEDAEPAHWKIQLYNNGAIIILTDPKPSILEGLQSLFEQLRARCEFVSRRIQRCLHHFTETPVSCEWSFDA